MAVCAGSVDKFTKYISYANLTGIWKQLRYHFCNFMLTYVVVLEPFVVGTAPHLDCGVIVVHAGGGSNPTTRRGFEASDT